MTNVLELIAFLEWIALGVFVFTRFRKLNKRLDEALDEIRQQEEEHKKDVCYQECNLKCDSCANDKEEGCEFKSSCTVAVFNGKQVSKPAFYVPKNAGDDLLGERSE